MAGQRKEKIHPVTAAVGADGKVNVHKFVAHTQQALGQVLAGHYTLENPTEEDLGSGRVKISFERIEKDAMAQAAESSVPA